MRRAIHRALRSLGLHLEKHREPVADLARLLNGRPVAAVVDGGAHKGGVSREFLSAFPAAQVHAFEPQPNLAAELREAASGCPRWHVHQEALSDREGAVAFHVPRDADYTASILTPIGSLARGPQETVEVPAVRLDDWAAREGVRPEVLKLDLQGFELPALRGAEGLLPGVRAVLCEVNFVPRYEGCTEFHEVTGFLAGHGFRLSRLYEVHTGPGGSYEFADALFVRGPGQ